MKCSILINNFNYATYLEECLQSALDQTYEDLEIIIVDDGSTDGSQDLIQAFAERSERPVQAVLKENGGQASAMNKGFDLATGDLILFLDADDFLAPDCVSRVVSAWAEEMSKLHFDLAIVNKDSQSIDGRTWNAHLPQGDLRQHVIDTGTVESAPTSGNVFSKRFLDTVMPIPEGAWKFNADAYLFNQAALAGHIGFIDNPIGFYRVHGRNGSAHTHAGKCVQRSIHRDIVRERRTDDLLADYAPRVGLTYRSNALTQSFAHQQAVFVFTALYGDEFSPGGTIAAYQAATGAMLKDKHLSAFKKAVIGIWQTGALVLPKGLREKLFVWGYKNGFVISKDKMIERAQH